MSSVDAQATSADWIRACATAVIDRALPEVSVLVSPSRAVSDDEMRRHLVAYLDALAQAIERETPAPLEAMLAQMSPWWPSGDFSIDRTIGGFYRVADLLDEFAARPESPEEARHADHVECSRPGGDVPAALRRSRSMQVERWTREAVARFARHALEAISGHFEGEIERHRAGEERLLSLQRVSGAVISDLDLDRTLSVIAEEACRLIHAGTAAIRLVEPDGGSLRLIASAGTVDWLLDGELLPVEGSLAGTCLRQALPIISEDVEHDARLSPELRRLTRLRSLLTVPLIVRDRPIGVLLVADNVPGAFGLEDQMLLSLFADQAASAIENGRLYQQAQEQIAELAILQRISSVISSSLDLDSVFYALYDEIRNVMPADAFVIGLARGDGHYDLEFIIDAGQRFAPRHGYDFSPAIQRAIDERRPVLIGDVLEIDSEELQYVGSPEARIRSLIAVPLVKGAEIVGLLSAQSCVPHHYRESDAHLLMTIANHAVVAIDHARLYQQAQSVAVAEERSRLAREIHDTLAQGLIGIILYLERLDLQIPASDTRLRSVVERALSLARGNLEEARRSVHDLRAAPLEGRTLLEALAHLVAELRKEGSFAATLTATGSLPMLTARVETALFRMVQEATSNCRKHSGCGSVEVRLLIEGSQLCIEVADDGRGFDVATKLNEAHRFGLSTMRERITQVGGEFSVESAPGGGTTVRASIPLDRAVHTESAAD